jgi:hypothetical protein
MNISIHTSLLPLAAIYTDISVYIDIYIVIYRCIPAAVSGVYRSARVCVCVCDINIMFTVIIFAIFFMIYIDI